MKYKDDIAKVIFQIQAETLCGKIETVKSDSEPVPSWDFNKNTIDRGWGPDDNDSDCEDNSTNIEMPDDSYFLRDSEELLEGYSTTLSA